MKQYRVTSSARYTRVHTGIFLLFLITSFLGAQEILSLDNAIQITLQNNYGILIAKDNMEIAANNYHPGNAGFLPNLDISLSYSRSRINSEQTYSNGSSQTRKDADSKNSGAGAALVWTIFDGFKMFASYSKLSGLEKIERYKLKREIELTISDVILTYYDVVRKKLILQVDREAVSISEQRLQIVGQGYDLGVSSNLDVLQAKVDLNTDRSAFLGQEVEVADAQSKLEKILARPAQNSFTVVDSIKLGPVLTVENLQEKLYNQNTDLRIGQEDLAVAKHELREMKAEKYPRLNLSSSYSYSRSESQAGFFNKNETNGYSYGASVSMNLFNGFNTMRREQNSRLTKRMKEIALEELKTNIAADFNNLMLKYQNSRTRMQLEQENVGVASENVKIALEIYQLGTITPLQLREVQRNYIAAKSRLISTAFEVKQNEVNLLRMSGSLDSE